MLGPTGPEVSRIAQEIVERRVMEILRFRKGGIRPNVETPVSLVARFIATSLLALVSWWIEQDMPQSPQELQRAYCALAGGAWGRSYGLASS